MMRWEPTEIVSGSENRGAGFDDDSVRPSGGGDRALALRYLLDAVLDTVSRVGARSLVLTLVLALIVATMFFGLSADETSAMLQWCPKCTGR